MTLLKSSETKKVNLDFNKEFINTFSQNIESRNVEFINQTFKDLHEADVANLIENLSPETRTKLIEIESFNIDPEIFIEHPWKATHLDTLIPIAAIFLSLTQIPIFFLSVLAWIL